MLLGQTEEKEKFGQLYKLAYNVSNENISPMGMGDYQNYPSTFVNSFGTYRNTRLSLSPNNLPSTSMPQKPFLKRKSLPLPTTGNQRGN